jgi:hypothetical protein
MEAFAVPIKPDKTEEWKAWTEELAGARKADLDALNERHGLTTHAVWLQENPDGSQIVVVVIDGPGAPTFLQNLATSDDEVDTWFRSKVHEVHPMDLSGPLPPPNQRFF